jgi:hypothetical protein
MALVEPFWMVLEGKEKLGIGILVNCSSLLGKRSNCRTEL